MKLSERIRLLLKAAANDLFGEEQAAEVRQVLNGETTAEHLTGLLDEAQSQLDTLRLELGNAVSHQKRIERAWQESAAQVKSLDAAADAAIQDGQEERAREYLAQLQSAQQNVQELEELARAGEQRSTDLRSAVNQQQEQLDVLRRRALTLTDRERSVTALAELLGDQQSLSRQTEKLHTELTAWEEQIARREDRISARREWSK
ncbi:MAG: PspA/IM30 family protein [Chloroflexi bacterium]|nr:PspA/IM30 family protein [Chloroflexota bacterium]